MTKEPAQSLSLTKRIAAQPEDVFAAWTQPEHMANWCCPDPAAKVDVDVDLRVGGAFSIVMNVEGGPYTARGVYKEVDAPRRVVYTWDWVQEDHRMNVETLVTVSFIAVDGGTEVHLTHEGFPSVEMRDAHNQGWTPCFDNLARIFA